MIKLTGVLLTFFSSLSDFELSRLEFDPILFTTYVKLGVTGATLPGGLIEKDTILLGLGEICLGGNPKLLGRPAC